MSLVNHLNFLGTMSIFASAAFAVSGIGIKLGKFTSSPHPLGFKYISNSAHRKELFKATYELNKDNLEKHYPFVKSAEDLEKWCGSYEKSTKKLRLASRYCQIKKNTWHQLIEHGVKLKDEPPKNGCSLDILKSYSDGPGDHGYLVGLKNCKQDEPAAAAAAK